MQGPIIDIVLLLALILFLGAQQRSRPQALYRFWLVGWILVFLSYAVWEFRLTRPVLLHVQDSIRFNLLLCGLLLFMMSFLPSTAGLRKAVVRGLMVGLPVVAVIDAREFMRVPRLVVIAAVLCWQVFGMRAAYAVLPAGRIKTRRAIFAICAVCAVGLPLYVALSRAHNLGDLACVQVLLCTAVLYGGGLERRSVTVLVGMAGFVAWACFYPLANWLAPMAWAQGVLHVMYMLWNVPKYAVGLSMMLKTLEDVAGENARLAQDFGSIYKGHMHPMWIYERESGECLSVNWAALEQYGFSRSEFLALDLKALEAPCDAEQEWMDEMLPSQPGERRTQHFYSDGRVGWVNVTERDLSFQGREARLVMARDVTEKVQAQQELTHRAHHDALTGLPNRTLLEDRIQQCMARCGRDGRKAVLLMIDLDHFKRVNDTYGHPVGDECLQMAAARMAVKIRQVDTIARVGGEEFSAMIGGLQSTAGAEKIAESLLRVFDTPLQVGDFEIPMSVSIGMAIYPDDGADAEELRLRADRALYAAKRLGRNCAVTAQNPEWALRLAKASDGRARERMPALEAVDFSVEAAT